MDETGNHYVKQDKPSSEKQISHYHSYADSRHNNMIIIKTMP
jgi:hypothetical protein